MIHTISWMVLRENEERRRQTSRVVVTMFLVGGLTGGLVAGAVVGLVGEILKAASVPRDFMRFFAGGSALVLSGAAAGFYEMPRLQLPHQVPVAWRELLSPKSAAFFYSASLGFGFATRIPSRAFYVLVLSAAGLRFGYLTTMLLFGIAGFVKASTGLLVPLGRFIEKGGEATVGELERFLWLSRMGEPLVLLAVGSALLLLHS